MWKEGQKSGGLSPQGHGESADHLWTLPLPTSVGTGIRGSELRGAPPRTVLDKQCQCLVCELHLFQSACRPHSFLQFCCCFQNKRIYAPTECFSCNADEYYNVKIEVPSPTPNLSFLTCRDKWLPFLWILTEFLCAYASTYIFTCIHTRSILTQNESYCRYCSPISLCI